MKRIVDAKEFSDLRTFEANDMVRIACNECSDCSKCCRTVGDSIILDPYDIYCLEKGLKTDFTGLLNSGRIELRCVDGLIQPNLKIRDNGAGCSFLNDGGRCGIHSGPASADFFLWGVFMTVTAVSGILFRRMNVPTRTRQR